MSITVNAIGTVSTAEVPDNWALKPADIGAGEQFRLIFQASGHPATSADIATYNSHVRSDAGAGVTALRSYADDCVPRRHARRLNNDQLLSSYAA